jgi:hypothetical protein
VKSSADGAADVTLEAIEAPARQELKGDPEVALADRMQLFRIEVPVFAFGLEGRVDLTRDEPAVEQPAIRLATCLAIQANLVE